MTFIHILVLILVRTERDRCVWEGGETGAPSGERAERQIPQEEKSKNMSKRREGKNAKDGTMRTEEK